MIRAASGFASARRAHALGAQIAPSVTRDSRRCRPRHRVTRRHSGAWRRGAATSTHPPGCGMTLLGLARPVGIEHAAQLAHHDQILGREHQRHLVPSSRRRCRARRSGCRPSRRRPSGFRGRLRSRAAPGRDRARRRARSDGYCRRRHGRRCRSQACSGG